MTDNKEVKKVEENMDSDKKTHIEDNEQVDITTSLIVATVPPKDIPEENEISELVVDDSEGSEGSIHELLES